MGEAWGEDLLMQRCMDLHGVDKVEAFDITTDSMCKAFRPRGQKRNAKWRPNCNDLNSRNAPFHEALRLFRMPEGHTAVTWPVESAQRNLSARWSGRQGTPKQWHKVGQRSNGVFF